MRIDPAGSVGLSRGADFGEIAIVSISTEGHSLATARVPWIDATRGTAVALVVMYHICLWHYLPLMRVTAPDSTPGAIWKLIIGLIGGFGMQVLMVISGVVAARRVRQGFRASAVAILTYYHVYVVWLVIYAIFSVAMPRPLVHDVGSLRIFLSQLILPSTTLWYVFALAVYVALMTAVRKLPSWLVLSALGLVSVLAFTERIDVGMLTKVVGLAFFFAIGVRGAEVISSCAAFLSKHRGARVATLAGSTLCTLGLIYADRFVESSRLGVVVLAELRNLVVICTALAWMVALTRMAAFRRCGNFFGARALIMYVLHVLFIELVMAATASWLSDPLRSMLSHPVAAALYPLGMTVLVVTVCIGLAALLHRAGLNFIFGRPEYIQTALDRAQSPSPASSAPGSVAPAAVEPSSP